MGVWFMVFSVSSSFLHSPSPSRPLGGGLEREKSEEEDRHTGRRHLLVTIHNLPPALINYHMLVPQVKELSRSFSYYIRESSTPGGEASDRIGKERQRGRLLTALRLEEG